MILAVSDPSPLPREHSVPAQPAPGAEPPATPPAASASSLERAKARESFASDEPLPAFTFPVLDETVKQELLKRVEQARPGSSLERVKAKESFAPDEPLPAFTYPVVDEATKLQILQRVEEARARAPGAAEPNATTAGSGSRARRPTLAELSSEVSRIGRTAWDRSSALVLRWIDVACAAIDRVRPRLPPRVRDALSTAPTGALLATLVSLAFGLFVGVPLLIGMRRSEPEAPRTAPSASPVAPAPKEDPVPREIDAAKEQGPAALEKLTARFPDDHRVWLALAASRAEKNESAAAVEAVGKALAADPRASEHALAGAVLAVVVRKRAATDSAFELLEGPMGSAGATVLYDLSIDPEASLALRGRAEQWIRSAAFGKVASPDVALAGSLRYARSCSARYDLLPSAGETGGRYTLAFLNVAKAPGGCGRGARNDCFPCLRKDDSLKNAIAAIEKRLGGG